MPNKKLVSALVIIVLVVLGAVGWVVFSKRIKKAEAPASAPTSAAAPVSEATKGTNKTVLDETKTSSGQTLKAVSGRLVSLAGREMVLESDGDRVRVLVSPDARVTRTSFPGGKSSPPQTEVITLDAVKVGDRVDALVKTKDGTVMASRVTVVVGS